MKTFKIIICCIFLLAPVVAAEEVPETLSYEFTGATCDAIKFIISPAGAVNAPVLKSEGATAADAFVCKTDYPLMTKRLASYGRVKTSKDRSGVTKRDFDTSDEKLLTVAGRQLYNDLMGYSIGKLFAISTAPLAYNSVTIVPYEQVVRDDGLIEAFRLAFEKASKLDAASE